MSDLDEPLGEGSAVRQDGRRGTAVTEPHKGKDGVDFIIIRWDDRTRHTVKMSELELQVTVEREDFIAACAEHRNRPMLASSPQNARLLAELRGMFRQHNVRVETAFHAFDRDGDGRISRSEFEYGLRALNIGLTPQQIDKTMRFMGAQHGQLTFDDFAEHLGKGVEGSPQELFAVLRGKCRQNNVSVEQAFHAFDRDGDGRISRSEFEYGLRALNI
eukprot:COSAG04_NODE_10618_length_763_cov_1.974398_1_plen_216_part_10